MSAALQIAGTCVAIARGGDPVGVLLRGPSGAGKSDLALRLIDSGALLVADDQVLIAEMAGACIAHAPETIRGLMEVRGVGILAVPSIDSARLALVIDLVPAKDVPRLPEPDFESLAGATLPLLVLNAFESSATAKINSAVQALNGPHPAGVTFPFASG